MLSPYLNTPVEDWFSVTEKIVEKHPLRKQDIVEAVLLSWDSIFNSRLGTKGFQIGKDIFPKPQIIGFLLHELIPLELISKYPNCWRADVLASDKDLVYIPDEQFSIEIKTSSDPRHIFGNRSYAQSTNSNKKGKSGYYLAVNFEKVSVAKKANIRLIRFGWIDSSDWIGQASQSGQQARLSTDVEKYKLLQLYP